MQSRLYNAIGLCMKAGKAKSGAYAAESSIRNGEARLVLLEESASDATRKRYVSLCGNHGVPIYTVQSIGTAIGKPGRIVLAVTDDSFRKMLEELLVQENRAGVLL